MQAKQQVAEFEEQKTKNAAEGEKFLAENAKKPEVKTTASGLQYQVLTEGTGAKPKASDKVRVHYKGTLLDGETFDDLRARRAGRVRAGAGRAGLAGRPAADAGGQQVQAVDPGQARLRRAGHAGRPDRPERHAGV